MKKTTILLFTFWSLAAIIVAWLLPFMARNSNVGNDFLSYFLTFIQLQFLFYLIQVKFINILVKLS